jgi:hypothetical protein
MTAGKYDFVIEQGATLYKTIDVSEVFPSLTSYTARLQIRETVDAATTVMDLQSTSGKLDIDAALCTVTIDLASSDTSSSTWSDGVWDLELTSPTGVVTRILEGKVTNSLEVTR